MRLSAKIVVNYANVNQFSYANQWKIRAGEPNTLYFQVVDLDQMDSCGMAGLRHMVGVGSINQPFGITVRFPSVDDSKTILATASMADPNDPSIWQVSISPIQTPNSGNVIFSVTEGSATRTFKLMNGLAVEQVGNDGSC